MSDIHIKHFILESSYEVYDRKSYRIIAKNTHDIIGAVLYLPFHKEFVFKPFGVPQAHTYEMLYELSNIIMKINSGRIHDVQCPFCGEPLVYFDDGVFHGYECEHCNAILNEDLKVIVEGDSNERLQA